jgi:hypothetical protein
LKQFLLNLNVNNPRIVTVASDVTFTANFTECVSNIASPRAESTLKAYPNPANSTLTVDFGKDVINGTVTLYDVNGSPSAGIQIVKN